MLLPDHEKTLVEGIRNGDETSLKQLVETYWRELNATALRILNNHSDANDCVQNGLIKAIEHINSYTAKGSFKGWLHRIVTNEALMTLRKRSVRKEDSLDDLMLEFDEYGRYRKSFQGEPVTLEELQESKEVRAQVRKGIEQLPEIFRITLLLRDIEGYSTKETAEMTETTEDNVKVRLHRARLALRNLLEPVYREIK